MAGRLLDKWVEPEQEDWRVGLEEWSLGRKAGGCG